MKIVLLGYMGSGKTTVGKKLATELKLQFLDLDDYIETAEKRTIPEIFNKKGEIYFRKKEHFYLEEVLSEKKNFVLSTGGGTPCYGNNIQTILNGTANVFYLKVALTELVSRLSKEKEERPLIKNISDDDLLEFIGKHLFERSYFYNQANKVIDCGTKKPEVIAKEITDHFLV